jgi:hypothetical protein
MLPGGLAVVVELDRDDAADCPVGIADHDGAEGDMSEAFSKKDDDDCKGGGGCWYATADAAGIIMEEDDETASKPRGGLTPKSPRRTCSRARYSFCDRY